MIIKASFRRRFAPLFSLFTTESASSSRLFLALCTSFILAGCGGTPARDQAVSLQQNLGHDWRKHYYYGMQFLQESTLAANSDTFARAAFSSAARFSRDYAPAFIGLGVASMRLGNFPDAQVAFLNAALIDDRSRYWAYSAIAALQHGDERVARALHDAMQAALIQDDDEASRFVRQLYNVQDYNGPMERIANYTADAGVSSSLLCQGNSSDSGNNTDSNESASSLSDLATQQEICRNLNIVTNVYFVRRFSTDDTSRGTDFFENLTFQLSAGTNKEFRRDNGDRSDSLLNQVELSIPAIQYALRVTPQLTKSSIQVSAAPSIMTSIGNESQITEGANLTILYNATGYAQQFTAETGTTLNLIPELATPNYVKLALKFEYSNVRGLSPSGNAQVLDVAKDTYAITGTFPYGQPVVLGTIASGTHSFSESGQSGLRRTPLLGGAFGRSDNNQIMSETIILGVLSEPEVFRRNREERIISVMQDKGVSVTLNEAFQRRKAIHSAPDIAVDAISFLKRLSP
ncbi:hypothetical protein GCM10010919_15390 [Alishewanella longhuensis]|uniref:Type II/III secretion system secretin-like domain-containing protein n=1 Tax=Alishewanella longhuensis TaxID=1091037 RepID=A0ABQ3KXA9_9ALTE|nr:hypothetical protein [Alishewanella longhuensis]GHG67015.1 hypothetical protein GCM10010919_15390 [Alishewanella longhuensis]